MKTQTVQAKLEAAARADYQFIKFTANGNGLLGVGYHREDGELHIVRQIGCNLLGRRITTADAKKILESRIWENTQTESNLFASYRFAVECDRGKRGKT